MSKVDDKNNITLKLLIDKSAGKVVYAEAGKDFIDFLFHALVQPVGATFRKLQFDNDGCLGNIYKSVQDFNTALLKADATTKEALLDPRSAASSYAISSPIPLWMANDFPAPPIWTHDPKSLNTCLNLTSNAHRSRSYQGDSGFSWCVSDVPGLECTICDHGMDTPVEVEYVGLQEGYVKAHVPYLVTDDLVVKPLSSNSVLMVLKELVVGKDMGSLEEKVVRLDTTKGMALIKASLTSKTVLTDTFLGKEIKQEVGIDG